MKAQNENLNLALDIIKSEIAQRNHANTHSHLRKDEITKEIQSLKEVVNLIESNATVRYQREQLILFLMNLDECYGMHVREDAEKCVDGYLERLKQQAQS